MLLSLNFLKKICRNLKKYVYDVWLQEFLEDYGMVWVGETTGPDSDVYLEETDSPVTGRRSTMPDGLWQPGN